MTDSNHYSGMVSAKVGPAIPTEILDALNVYPLPANALVNVEISLYQFSNIVLTLFVLSENN